MNLFKILSTGDGSIKEPSVSAFLAYLIDNQEHKFATALLERLLLPSLSNSTLAPNLCNEPLDEPTLNPDYTYSIDLEYSVYPNEIIDRRRGRSDIDILVTFTHKQDEEDRFHLAIENKTSGKSLRQGQALKQFDGLLKQGIDSDRIFYLLITPSGGEAATSELESLPTVNKGLIVWKDIATNLTSFVHETNVEDIYFQQTLLAFCEFVGTNFKSYQEEVKNRKRRPYNKRGDNLACFLSIYEQMSTGDQISRLQLEELYVNELAILGLTPSATDAQVSRYIVNEPNRCNHGVRPDNPNHNLFYYTQQQGPKNTWLLKKVMAGTFPNDLTVYWKSNGQRQEDYLIKYRCHPMQGELLPN